MSSSRPPSPSLTHEVEEKAQLDHSTDENAAQQDNILPHEPQPNADTQINPVPQPDAVDYSEDFQKFTALATRHAIADLKLTAEEHSVLSPKDKKHFHVYLQHCQNVDANLNAETPNQDEVKKELSLAASALKKLNSRPVAAACFAVLSVVAAAAAVAFLWPAAVVASIGITAMYLGAAAVTTSITAATLSGLNANGVFKKSKYDDLKKAQEKLAEEAQAAFRTPTSAA